MKKTISQQLAEKTFRELGIDPKKEALIPPHGGYKNLLSFQTAEIIYDFTVTFCNTYKSYLTYKTYEQMTGAGRSGKQNIAEGSMDSGTSKKVEIKLIGIARGSLEELLLDYLDFLRQNNFSLWDKDCEMAKNIRQLAYKSNKSYMTYKTYMTNPETAANCAVCLIHQANFLLDRQLKSLENEFLAKGGFTENMYRLRKEKRKK